MARFTRGAQKLVRSEAKFIIDPTIIPKLATAAEMGVMLGTRATAVANAVRAIAPVGESEADERYIDMIEAVVQLGRKGLIGRVNAHKFTSAFLEFGTIYMAARAPLRRGLESTGLRLVRER